MSVRAVFLRPSNKTGSAYLSKWGFLPAPLGLLALAGEILRIKGSRVKIIDMEGDNLSLDQAVEKTLDFRPDLVGITLHATAAHNNAGYIARSLKQHDVNILTVAGGHHATFLPREIIRSGFDVSVLGEGDETIYDIGNVIEGEKDLRGVPGIVYRNSTNTVRTRPRKLIPDLDSLPLPPIELLDSRKYTFKVFGEKDTVMCLETSRGCPYACDFCSVTPTWGNKWRNKSNDRILKEMKLAVLHGYNWIFFTDDIFIVYPNLDQRRKLIDKVMDENIRARWIVQMRADVTARNPEIIEKAAMAGMRVAFLGVESGSEEILKKMHKGEFTPQSVQAVKTLSRNGIITLVGMMIGAPYERFRDIISTIRFSRKLAVAGADAIQFSIYTPLPGTRVFDDALRNGNIFTLDWDRFDVLTPTMKTKVGPVADQLTQFYAYYSFYVYKFIMGKLKNIPQPGEKKNLIDNALVFMKKMMPSYLKDFLAWPRILFQTYDSMHEGMRRKPDIGNIEEILETSNKVVYDLGNSKNPYFMIKESK